MTVSRRVAGVEASLDPLAIVLKVIAHAQEYPSLDAYARAIAEVPVEAAPLSRIGTEIEASVRSSLKGRPPDEVGQAVWRAIGDAVFRYILFLRLNTSALELADHEGLRAAAAFYWMGCLLSGPRKSDLESAEWGAVHTLCGSIRSTRAVQLRNRDAGKSGLDKQEDEPGQDHHRHRARLSTDPARDVLPNGNVRGVSTRILAGRPVPWDLSVLESKSMVLRFEPDTARSMRDA
jgi:hypothetical protein